MYKIVQLVLVTGILLLSMSCSDNSTNSNKPAPIDSTLKMTFVELGADWCEPCKNMRPIMDSIQRKYGAQILVKFIDVIKNSQEAEPYHIVVMPTQVFLDSNNVEIHRHEGFYPEDSIHIFLQSKGLKILSK
jgi:thioredoxin 1